MYAYPFDFILSSLGCFCHQLCAALNVNKLSVDRDLDVYRNLLSKLVQAKELLMEYVERYFFNPLELLSAINFIVQQTYKHDSVQNCKN